ncbi:hypothetical protein COW81_00375 [Candidatus Campbellbacteria bacterium CG22_combo_CG10-13_8_21_14_all_36_13]|uniref:N-acetyltransferase domain-containing protein n=1 Tax=Candidatus Campbellbacteria bacterium CG22_combo_CG10-13_8_21_14_all_36_13 TaxID=1974529 RepID=A0A2H0E0B6_9BACT|nr:MAG: hypothetical protein COW81_00375 [Candidatus Campbellbacteria bacterium CG22_combo_CG10-13_8_21_14_all_36_13]
MITISKPKQEDSEDIYNLIKASWYATYVNEEVGIIKEDIDAIYNTDPAPGIKALMNRANNPTERDVSFVAKDDTRIVGYIRLRALDNEIELLSLYINPDSSGQGIGTQLWEKARIGDFVVTTRITDDLAEKIDRLYKNVSEEDLAIKKLQEIFKNPGPLSVKLENNPKKARALRKKLSKNFYIPKELIEKYDLF